MGIVRNILTDYGTEVLTRERLREQGPSMTDEDLALPYVGEDEAFSRGRKRFAKISSALAVALIAEAGVVFALNHQDNEPQPLRVPITPGKQCPAPGTQNV